MYGIFAEPKNENASMPFDRHGQPTNRKFNDVRNKDKAVSGLLGILHGVTVDEALNSQELLFLDTWLRSQEYLKEDGDIIDLLDLIGDILSDGKMSAGELTDLQLLCNDVVGYKESPVQSIESKTNHLIGLLTGIAADGTLEDSEIYFVRNWLDENADLADVWPADIIWTRLRHALEDGKIDGDERSDLLETFKQITGARFEETGLAHGMATDFLEDAVDSVEHEDKCFCFTGKFVTGGRKTVENSVILRGATTKPRITKGIDYLVIGTLASRDWRFSSHGRKIEEALKLRKKGASITILTERTWLNFL